MAASGSGLTNKNGTTSMLDPRLTSFLEKDTSFLSPWSWDPNTSNNETSTNEKEYLYFHPGSYFASQIFDRESGSNFGVNYNQPLTARWSSSQYQMEMETQNTITSPGSTPSNAPTISTPNSINFSSISTPAPVVSMQPVPDVTWHFTNGEIKTMEATYEIPGWNIR